MGQEVGRIKYEVKGSENLRVKRMGVMAMIRALGVMAMIRALGVMTMATYYDLAKRAGSDPGPGRRRSIRRDCG